MEIEPKLFNPEAASAILGEIIKPTGLTDLAKKRTRPTPTGTPGRTLTPSRGKLTHGWKTVTALSKPSVTPYQTPG